MNAVHRRFALFVTVSLAAATLATQTARAQQTEPRQAPPATAQTAEQATDTRELLRNAAEVVKRMKIDPELTKVMQEARGIFIVPNFVRGALLVGARGGEGVMLARQNGDRWSGPVFYNVGGISVGLQAGGEAGAVAFLLMNDKAVDAFKRGDSFSLDAEAGYSIADYSAARQASAREGRDIIAWSDTEGLFAGASVGIQNVNWDEEQTRAYYGEKDVLPASILRGEVKTPRDPAQGSPLDEALKG